MPTDPIPTFDEWVRYCFTQGYADFADYGTAHEEEFDLIEARTARYLQMPSLLVTEYVIRLFSDPAFIAKVYTEDQIADGIGFLFGGGSEYTRHFLSPEVPIEAQRRAIASVETMYTYLFDRVCNLRGTDPDGCYYDRKPIDMRVLMIWDMDGIDGSLYRPQLVQSCLIVLETALLRCRTSSCKASAIHAFLDHEILHQGQARSILARYRAAKDEPEYLREYAEQAWSRW